jgi:hypothetical protein
MVCTCSFGAIQESGRGYLKEKQQNAEKAGCWRWWISTSVLNVDEAGFVSHLRVSGVGWRCPSGSAGRCQAVRVVALQNRHRFPTRRVRNRRNNL